ncbi:hypothetical protein LZP81_14470 [Streptomyces parvulus]|uniref:hypothetical protein n=1 Tax=Streptomyces parvulus TaxID=146923 RepID=UPI001E559D26|nr:hypothetical protein [Streptomyces parvulus]MCC9155658.1 hypothetical protein [Streptomyces parvulus]MCE7688062.1 hypothetical protein [Streptomyces parvulus]
MYPEHTPHAPTQRAVQIRQPTPYPPAALAPAPAVPVRPGTVPAVASIVLPDGRVVTGYAIEPAQPEPVAAKPAVSRTAVNVALGGVGFLAAVLFGGWVVVLVLTADGHQSGGTTVNIRKAVIKRNKFYS